MNKTPRGFQKEASFPLISGKLSRAQSPDSCPRCPVHPSTTGDHFWTGIQARDGKHCPTPETTSLPTCTAANPGTFFSLEGEGDDARRDLQQQKAWLRSRLVSQEAVQRNPLLRRGRSPAIPTNLASPQALSPYFPLRRLGYKRSGRLQMTQQQCKREVLRAQPVTAGWGFPLRPQQGEGWHAAAQPISGCPHPRTKPGCQQAAAATSLSPACAARSLTRTLGFSQERCSFRSPQPPVAGPCFILLTQGTSPARQHPAEDAGAPPCPRSRASVPPCHLVLRLGTEPA